MAKGGDLKRKARSLYVFKRMNQTMIGLELGISPTTIGRWKKAAKADGNDWDKARQANMLAGDGINAVVAMAVEEFVVLAQATIEQIKAEKDMDLEKRTKHLTSLADAMVKMTNSAARLAPEISELGVAQDVIRRLLKFVREEFPQHGDAIQDILEPFGAVLARAYE